MRYILISSFVFIGCGSDSNNLDTLQAGGIGESDSTTVNLVVDDGMKIARYTAHTRRVQGPTQEQLEEPFGIVVSEPENPVVRTSYIPSLGVHGFFNGPHRNCYLTSIIQGLFHTRRFYNGLVVESLEYLVSNTEIPEEARNVLIGSESLARDMWADRGGQGALLVDDLFERMRNFVNDRSEGLFVVGRDNGAREPIYEYLSALEQAGVGDWFKIQTRSNDSLFDWFSINATSESIARDMIESQVELLPPVLIIFTEQTDIIFDSLDLTSVTQNQGDLYELVSQVIHSQEGHYLAQYRHHITGHWIRSDDQIVQNLGDDHGFNPYTLDYMIFERR